MTSSHSLVRGRAVVVVVVFAAAAIVVVDDAGRVAKVVGVGTATAFLVASQGLAEVSSVERVKKDRFRLDVSSWA